MIMNVLILILETMIQMKDAMLQVYQLLVDVEH